MANATYIVECYWPGVTQAAVDAADARARRHAAAPGDVRYLGSLIIPADEVVFFEFEASSAAQVRRASVAAALPFDRVVESVRVDARARLQSGARSPRRRTVTTQDEKAARKLAEVAKPASSRGRAPPPSGLESSRFPGAGL